MQRQAGDRSTVEFKSAAGGRGQGCTIEIGSRRRETAAHLRTPHRETNCRTKSDCSSEAGWKKAAGEHLIPSLGLGCYWAPPGGQTWYETAKLHKSRMVARNCCKTVVSIQTFTRVGKDGTKQQSCMSAQKLLAIVCKTFV